MHIFISLEYKKVFLAIYMYKLVCDDSYSKRSFTLEKIYLHVWDTVLGANDIKKSPWTQCTGR